MWKRKKETLRKVNWSDVQNFAKEVKENKQHMIVFFASEFCFALGITPQQCDTIKFNLSQKGKDEE